LLYNLNRSPIDLIGTYVYGGVMIGQTFLIFPPAIPSVDDRFVYTHYLPKIEQKEPSNRIDDFRYKRETS